MSFCNQHRAAREAALYEIQRLRGLIHNVNLKFRTVLREVCIVQTPRADPKSAISLPTSGLSVYATLLVSHMKHMAWWDHRGVEP